MKVLADTEITKLRVKLGRLLWTNESLLYLKGVDLTYLSEIDKIRHKLINSTKYKINELCY